ncbi:unnamed protein product [Chrysoparadoxa australica]
MTRVGATMPLEKAIIPNELKSNSATVKMGKQEMNVSCQVTSVTAPKFRQIRAAVIETDGPTQVLNFVMFPHQCYDLPVFGADLVSLPGGHLILIDLQPARLLTAQERDGDYISDSLCQLRLHWEKILPWGGDLPDAALPYFSPHCIWSRFESSDTLQQQVFPALLEYLDLYLGLVPGAEEEKSDGMRAALERGHLQYCEYRRVNDPARGMLTKYFGSEWTEALIHDVLFNLK